MSTPPSTTAMPTVATSNDAQIPNPSPSITLSTSNTTSPPTSPSSPSRQSTALSPPTSRRSHSPQPFVTIGSARHPSSRPSSIPSSPTSIHSSSSAIFERDIEPLHLSSRPSDPHHTSRAKSHEPLDSSVPSVLSSAVSALSISSPTATSPTSANPNNLSGGAPQLLEEEISVISPIVPASTLWSPIGGTSGLASPVSRSPSPTMTSARPLPQRSSSASMPLPPLPGSFSPAAANSSSPASSPSPTLAQPLPLPRSQSPSPSPRPINTSDVSAANKRLSFISYHDLLLATPVSTVPLSSLTSPTTASNQSNVPQQSQNLGLLMEGVNVGPTGGGEWEREGLGKGLEERLEEILVNGGRS